MRTSRMSPLTHLIGWQTRWRAWGNVLPSCSGQRAALGVTGQESFSVPNADHDSPGSSSAGPVRTVGLPLGVSPARNVHMTGNRARSFAHFPLAERSPASSRSSRTITSGALLRCWPRRWQARLTRLPPGLPKTAVHASSPRNSTRYASFRQPPRPTSGGVSTIWSLCPGSLRRSRASPLRMSWRDPPLATSVSLTDGSAGRTSAVRSVPSRTSLDSGFFWSMMSSPQAQACERLRGRSWSVGPPR